LSVCPRCETKVAAPIKTWSMVGRPSRTGEHFKLTLGLFACPNCEKRFIEVVAKERERATLKGRVNEIKGIERSLVHTLGDLKEKIEKLKRERAELLDEIEQLKRAGEEKADTLENEVASLREEVESLKEMLGDLE
jgi:septal ring factor EnvC (AmiA/AmiB activator)